MQSAMVGVFTTRSIIQKLHAQEPPFDKNRLQEANREAKTTLFFFSIIDVDLERQLISGTYYNETSKTWEIKSYPFPEVVYNRRSEGSTSEIRRFREMVSTMGIITINPINDFNKWELYRYLSLVPEMQGHLPHTVLFEEERNMQDMLQRYQTIYLKPAVGRYSRKVVRVKLLEEGKYVYSYVDDQLRIKTAEGFEQLVNFTRVFFQGKKFIVQEAIRVINLNERNVDMRAELQRNYQGDLEIVAISVRLAALHSPVTTTRAKTTVFKFADFFRENLPYTETLYNRVNIFLKKIFLGVEKIYGVFGDMGIDFALDKDLNLWLIECNAKSSKMPLFLSFDQPVIYRSFLNPLEYAKFLTGLQKNGLSLVPIIKDQPGKIFCPGEEHCYDRFYSSSL